ncbi:MAG: hypothetical protein FJ298_02350 [Planctomycetes bacterium]|nr:hypothetical protein [Planctomycetota bacterium]
MKHFARTLVLVLPFALSACIEQADLPLLFKPSSASVACGATTPIRVRERQLAFLADELTTGAGGTDMNGDGDRLDRIAVIVDMVNGSEVRLDVAARELAFAGNNLYLVVDEVEDSSDYNADSDALDLVLMRVASGSPSPGGVSFVAELRRTAHGPAMVATDNEKLFYCAAAGATPLAAGETGISVITLTGGAPNLPVRVLHDDAFTMLAAPELLGSDGNVLFVGLDESDEGRDLNADTDMLDDHVLALANAALGTPKIKSTLKAMADHDSPLRAAPGIGGETIVAFLVDEASQGSTSLNNYAGAFANWRPAHCTSNDTDATDEVLHYVWLSSFLAGTTQPVNTALAGEERVLVASNGTAAFVASIVPESDDGNCATVGLNNDGDTGDDVLRWLKVEAQLGSSGVFTAATGLVALADVPGGTEGATDFNGRWIVVIDEAADGRSWDGEVSNPANNVEELVAWLDPADGNSAQWISDHSPAPGFQCGGSSWMGELEDRARVGVGFQESVFGAPINGRDNDTLDSVPTFSRFDPTDANDFDFPGPAVAVDADNVGLVISNNIAYYRVDEAADNFDWNGDGDKLDRVLFRTTVSTLADSYYLSPSSDVPGPVVVADSANVAAAFLAEESAARVDLNGDGDKNDFVVRWMRVGP